MFSIASTTRFSDRPLIITVAPSPARIDLIPRPMPAVEPVTSASLPDSCKSMIAPLTAAVLCHTYVGIRPMFQVSVILRPGLRPRPNAAASPLDPDRHGRHRHAPVHPGHIHPKEVLFQALWH